MSNACDDFAEYLKWREDEIRSTATPAMTSANWTEDGLTIAVDQGRAGLFYATSPDLKGLLVASATIDGLKNEVPQAIKALRDAREVENRNG